LQNLRGEITAEIATKFFTENKRQIL